MRSFPVVTFEEQRVEGTAMTSFAGQSCQEDGVQEDAKPGPSGYSLPGPAVHPKEEPHLNDESCPSEATRNKRILSTVDPDYAHPPNTKRMREMHQRAQDELSQRVIKVVEKELHKAIVEKEAEMEEIDARILRLQQCLHTVRYCASLSYYNVGKGETQTRDRKLSGLHPAIRRHLGEAPQPPLPTTERLTTGYTFHHNTHGLSTDQKGKELSKDSQSKSQLEGSIRASTNLSPNTTPTATHSSSESTTLPSSCSQYSDETSETQTGAAKEGSSSRPPSPKYLPPLPPDNTATIAQGRQQRLQHKRRLIVGNTYQYLAPLPGEEVVDSFRYKWQVYVRAPPSDPDTSTFLQSVTFVLDHSYAPHHMITIKQPPFVLSRRGWGEFKVQLTLRFMDQRNKPIRLLHPLVLSRPDDALALTGLWRLGQENWYDLWVYLPNPKTGSSTDGCAQVKEEESGPATLTQELETGVITSQIEDNVTVDHETVSRISSTPQYPSEENCAKTEDVNEESGCVRMLDNSVPVVKEFVPMSSLIKTGNEEKSTKEESEKGDRKEGPVNGNKTCTVLVRQSDGTLEPYTIPLHLYPLALQIAQDHGKQNKTTSNVISIKKLIPETKASEGIVLQGADCIAKGKKIQLKDTLNPVTFKLPIHQSNAVPSSTVGSVAGGMITTPEGTIRLAEAGTSQGKLRVVPAATDTATTTCPQHVLLQMGIKDKKLALIQKQQGGKSQKQALTSTSFRLLEVQKLSPLTPSLSSVKHVGKIPLTSLPQAVNQNNVPASGIRFIASNGQLITTEKLKSLNLQLHTDVKKYAVVNSRLPATTTTTSTASIAAASTSTSSTPGLVIQGGRVVVGTNTLQLVTSQGKVAMKQLSPLNMHSNKASDIPVQPLMLNNKGNLVVIGGSSGQVKGASQKIKMEVDGETKFIKVKDSSSLLRAVSGTGSKDDASSERNVIGANNRESKLEEDQDNSDSTYWEDYLSRACEACKSSISPEVCVSLWLKVLPIVQPSQLPPSPFSFCRAKSYQQFLRWPLPKQRACEFQRAREVRCWLEECQVEGWERWTVPRVVAWARSHAHTPAPQRPVIRTDKLQLETLSPTSGNSLSYVGDLEELEHHKHQSDTACTSDSPEVDVVDVEEEEESQGCSKRTPGSPLKRQLDYLQWKDGEMGSACEWVGQLTSQLRLSLYPEEVAEGYMADAARGTLWKGAVSLMEDLLRGAHFQAWNEATDIPPRTITLNHVLAALTTSRPEFDMLTDHGLGTPSETL